MMQAAHLVSLYHRLPGYRPCGLLLRTVSTEPRWEKTQVVDQLWSIKTAGGKKKKRTTAIISAEDNQTFRQLRGRIIALKARELNILAGNLDKEPALVSNPAEILNLTPPPRPSFSCPSCGKEFKTEKGSVVHARKCKVKTGVGGTCEIKDKVKLIEETFSAQTVKNDNKVTLTTQSTPPQTVKLKKGKIIKVEKETSALARRQEETLRRDEPLVSAYFDVFVNSGRVEDALENFKQLRSDPSSRHSVDNVQVYDLLMRGFARRFQFGRVQELWQDMMARGIEPTVDSYISSMIALSNSDPAKNIFKVVFRQVFNEFTEKGYSLDKALQEGRFQFEDRKLFLRSIDYLADVERSNTHFKDTPYSNPLLTSLPQSSDLLESQLKTIMERSELDPLVEQQLRSEKQRTVKVSSIVQEQFKISDVSRTFMSALEQEWRSKLTSILTKQRKSRLKLAPWEKGKRLNLYLFLSCVPVPVLVDIVLSTAKHLIQNAETYSLPSHLLISQLGTEVMNAYFFHTKVYKNESFLPDFSASYSRYLDWFSAPGSGERTHRAALLGACLDLGLEEAGLRWPEEVLTMVGRELKDLFIKELCITRDKNGEIVVNNKIISDDCLHDPSYPLSSNPAFFKVYRPRQNEHTFEETKPHPSLSSLYSVSKMAELEFSSVELPMVCPPLPWLSTTTGAFLLRTAKLVRVPETLVSDQEEKLQNLSPELLSPVLDSVNHLSSVPWRVNQVVLELAKTVFTKQDDRELLADLSLPLHPDNIQEPDIDTNLEKIFQNREKISSTDLQAYQQQQLEKSAYIQIKRESYSQWCDTVYRLSIANHFKDQVLWFPHNMDFRGRVYPIPPYFNHMGADLARSLLVFARGKPLGRAGFDWLKLHCINLTGLKKRESVEERLQYAEEIMDLILDSAENPLTGQRWFLKSDEPWQTFSACVEIRNALRHPDGPEQYVCHLPIHQDGSCNGLQHYAAIGRDVLGAAAVNLVPADKPQDVYSEIAAIVERKRREDAERGDEVAAVLDGFVNRKVVKQTVMTTVYGVTHYGAAKQIARQLKDISDFPAEFVQSGSKYLGEKTFQSLNELFTASQEIQDWLTECAKAISGECEENVEWVTPLGFPVVQPYTRRVYTTRNLSLDKSVLGLKGQVQKERRLKVMTTKHRNGFAPNFIHSLDSSHMMLTALYLWHKGITFASVHDCYWTHACDVPVMNATCRDQFVALHSFPILENLSQSFLERYLQPLDQRVVAMENKMHKRTAFALQVHRKKRELLFKQVPKKGDLDLNVVKDSVYFFS